MSEPNSANNIQEMSDNILTDNKRKRVDTPYFYIEESDFESSDTDLDTWPDECFLESNSLPLPPNPPPFVYITPDQLFEGRGWYEVDLQMLLDMEWAEITFPNDWLDAPNYDTDTDTSDCQDMPPLEDVDTIPTDISNEWDQDDVGFTLSSIFEFHHALSTFEANMR